MSLTASLPDDIALLVEGNDEVQVINRIAALSSLPRIPMLNAEGINNLLDLIEPQVEVENRQALGIIVDANDNLNARWQSLSHELALSGITLPPTPDPAGTIIPAQNDLPRVGVWLWPNNQSPGELEDFIISLIPENDPVWPLSEEYINNILAQNLNKFPQGKKSRAQVHAWLAAREDPRRMGQAIQYGDLNPHAPPLSAFAAWLARLFPPA